ncbi:hemerythrin domain-containing protein, partial [Haematococcus lacustris]
MSQDHDNIRALFLKYRACSPNDRMEKLSVARQLVTTISQHASAEERTLYPMLATRVPKEDGSKLLHDMMVMDDQ